MLRRVAQLPAARERCDVGSCFGPRRFAMSTLIVPPLDAEPWPTLGPTLWEWMLDWLVYGPGDLHGVALHDHPPDEEWRALVYRMYEVHPLPEDVLARAST